jgi:hypothetical protein
MAMTKRAPSKPRNDPSSAPRDRGLNARVRNPEPGMTYVLVSLSDQYQGVPHYLDLGWGEEIWREGGPSFPGKPGEMGQPMVYMGQQLMSMSQDAHTNLQQYGIDGEGGVALGARIRQSLGDSPLRLAASEIGNHRGVALVDERSHFGGQDQVIAGG